MAKKKEEQKVAAVFDPKKTYSWQSEDRFTLNGSEFGALTNSLKSLFQTEMFKTVGIVTQLTKLLDEVLKRSVEQGIAKEAEEKKEPN